MMKFAQIGAVVLTVVMLGCNRPGSDGGDGQSLSGMIRVDGSSTVFPITEAMAEEF